MCTARFLNFCHPAEAQPFHPICPKIYFGLLLQVRMPMIAWKLYYTVFCIDVKNRSSSSILLQIHWCSKVSERRWISLWHVQVSSGGTQVASEPTIALETSKEEKYVLMASNQPSLDLPSCRHIVFWPIERSNKYVYSLGGQEVKIRGQNHKLPHSTTPSQCNFYSFEIWHGEVQGPNWS